MSAISCILYPPTLDYHYLVQRPQQLMKCLSELCVPVIFLNQPGPGAQNYRGIKKANPFLYLFYDVDPHPFLEKIRPVIYFSSAMHVDLVKTYNPSLLVFDSVDEPSDEFKAWRPYYQRAVTAADVVIATSDRLYYQARNFNASTYLVPNGCDYRYFSQAAGKGLPIPADMQGISGPVIGYIGAVASWCDLELIEKLAGAFPHYNMIMIGPLYNISKVPQMPNIHWLGYKPYNELASYIQLFDLGIIPFKRSNMIEAVNPIKMWEYLASGVPIVTTAIPEAQKYAELIKCSANHQEFIENVATAMNNDSPELKRQRMELARQNSWETRALQIKGIIEEKLAERYPNTPSFPINIPEQMLESKFLKGYNPVTLFSPGSTCKLTVVPAKRFKISGGSGNIKSPPKELPQSRAGAHNNPGVQFAVGRPVYIHRSKNM